jgi:hypothetical protein
MSASKAALAICSEYDRNAISGKTPCVVAFPTVVIDGRLFDCHLGPDMQEIEVQEVNYGALVSRNPVVGEPHTIVLVMTEEGLQKELAHLREGASAIVRCMLRVMPSQDQPH